MAIRGSGEKLLQEATGIRHERVYLVATSTVVIEHRTVNRSACPSGARQVRLPASYSDDVTVLVP